MLRETRIVREISMEETRVIEKTEKLKAVKQLQKIAISEAGTNGTGSPKSASSPEVPAQLVSVKQSKTRSQSVSTRDAANASALQERCRQLCLSLFFREHAPVRSLGFTSATAGEGKSFLTTVMASVLAKDVSNPVTLLECNWEHPSLHEQFGIPSTPGVAEWLRGDCDETAIRHRIDPNLTVIPAGEGRPDAVKLAQRLRQQGLLAAFTNSPNELLVVDLPAIVTCAYGSLLASLVESLIIVVRAGVTTDRMLVETCAQLKDRPVEGVILNQVASRIPRWIRQVL